MILPVTTVILFASLTWVYSKDGTRSPLMIALSLWVIAVVLPAAPIYRYQVSYSLVADLFVAGGLLATTIGYFLIRARTASLPVDFSNNARELRTVRILGTLGILGCILLFLSAGGRISPSSFVENLSATRAEGFDKLQQSGGAGALTILGSSLASCSFLALIATAKLGRAGGRVIVGLGVANFILVGTVGLVVFAGRTSLFLAAFVVVTSMWLNGRRIVRLSPRAVLAILAAVVGAWYFAVTFVETREEGLNAETTLQKTQRADYRSWIAPLARSSEGVGVGLVSLGYFASPLPTLAFYLEQKPVPGPLGGQYSFPLPTRAVQVASGASLPPWIETRRQVFSPLDSRGYLGNVYATLLRDLLVDFGYIGALLFCLFLGGAMAGSRNAFERTGRLAYHYVEVLLCFIFGYGAFAGLLFFTFVSVSFFVAMALAMWTAVARPLSSQRNARMDTVNYASQRRATGR